MNCFACRLSTISRACHFFRPNEVSQAPASLILRSRVLQDTENKSYHTVQQNWAKRQLKGQRCSRSNDLVSYSSVFTTWQAQPLSINDLRERAVLDRALASRPSRSKGLVFAAALPHLLPRLPSRPYPLPCGPLDLRRSCSVPGCHAHCPGGERIGDLLRRGQHPSVVERCQVGPTPIHGLPTPPPRAPPPRPICPMAWSW